MQPFIEKHKGVIKTSLSVTLVAWFSSYLYDALLIPNLFDGLLNMLSIVFSSFVDYSVGLAIHSSNFPYLKTFWILVIPIFEVIDFRDFVKSDTRKTFFKWVARIMRLFFILFTGLIFSLNILTYNLIVPSVRNHIEILEPYISEEKYQILKSDYYRISTYDDYRKLENEIEDIMNENQLDSVRVPYEPDK